MHGRARQFDLDDGAVSIVPKPEERRIGLKYLEAFHLEGDGRVRIERDVLEHERFTGRQRAIDLQGQTAKGGNGVRRRDGWFEWT